jgi:ABC-2 type transport system ATP-binding protein
LHEPEILVLDEPTSGIDPFGRREIWQVVKQLAKNGVAVLVTTHFIEEAEYCDRIGVMTQGRLIGEGAPSEIKAAAGNVLEIFTPEVRDAFECVSKHIAPWRISILPDCLHIQSEKSEFVCSLIERELRISGLTFSKPRLISPSLEEAVISLVHDSGGAAQ